MIINKNTDSEHVKFISYTGKYPNLCSGILTLEIDGRTIRFGNRYVDSTVDYPKFWESGGSCSFDNNWNSNVTDREWQIDFNEIPDCFKKYAEEIDEIFNANVPYGCCGGCL
jgi:hypothetical protein|nr:MAG TPA: hypothetical protein [Caudoviricetes sp.]